MRRRVLQYLPMLEELDYIPTRRYAFGEEIRQHLQAVADRSTWSTDALFHTGVTQATWDDDTGTVDRSTPTAVTNSPAATTCWPWGSST